MSELLDALPDRIEAAARQSLDLACARDMSIVSAESCTGGLLASLLTDVEGASHAFERGFVAYSPSAKCELLGVDREMIEACNAVSRDVAIAMARGALRASHADVAIAITGFAGPAGPADEPGLVHFAIADRSGGTTHRVEHFGNIGRGPVRLAAIEVALDMICHAIS